MKTHTRVDSISSLKTAEEAALLLQHKLCKIIVSVLRSSGKFSPKLGPGGSPLIKSTNNSKAPSPGTSPPIGNGFEALNLSLIGFSENRKNEDSARERYMSHLSFVFVAVFVFFFLGYDIRFCFLSPLNFQGRKCGGS